MSLNVSKGLHDAGSYPAAYGTSAFVQNVFVLSQRHEVAMVIGRDAKYSLPILCVRHRCFFCLVCESRKSVFNDCITT